MLNTYLYILIFLFITYVVINYVNNHIAFEGFAQLNPTNYLGQKYYSNRETYTDIFDEFYTFLYDIIFFNEDVCTKQANILKSYHGNIYNNSLMIGTKHGGHLHDKVCDVSKDPQNNRLLSQAMTRPIAVKCKMNYPRRNNGFYHLTNYNITWNGLNDEPIEPQSMFGDNTFTQISIIDLEIYYRSNIVNFINTISSWIVHKGFLIIDVFESKSDFIKFFSDNIKKSDEILKGVRYKRELQQQDDENYYSFIETFQKKKNEEKRINNHRLFYHHNSEIKMVCENQGFKFLREHRTQDRNINRAFLVFQKIN